jgi:uncharacterized membrane protein YdjX (TVP38/TMEM64 family)
MTRDTKDPQHELISQKPRNWWKPVLLVIVILSVFVIVNIYGFGGRLEEIKDWIQSLGIWGPAAFFFIYLGSVIITIPGTILGVAAGALFGSVVAIILVNIASTVGASLTFLIARYFARDAVARWLSKNETMRKLDEMTEKQGIFIVAITRLVPLFPFTLLNYGFGLTKVSFRTYLFWSWLCMIPGTIVFVVGGDAIMRALSEGTIPWILVGVVVIAAICLGVIVWYARYHLFKKTEK